MAIVLATGFLSFTFGAPPSDMRPSGIRPSGKRPSCRCLSGIHPSTNIISYKCSCYLSPNKPFDICPSIICSSSHCPSGICQLQMSFWHTSLWHMFLEPFPHLELFLSQSKSLTLVPQAFIPTAIVPTASVTGKSANVYLLMWFLWLGDK